MDASENAELSLACLVADGRFAVAATSTASESKTSCAMQRARHDDGATVEITGEQACSLSLLLSLTLSHSLVRSLKPIIMQDYYTLGQVTGSRKWSLHNVDKCKMESRHRSFARGRAARGALLKEPERVIRSQKRFGTTLNLSLNPKPIENEHL